MKNGKRRTRNSVQPAAEKKRAPATSGFATWHIVAGVLLMLFVVLQVYGPAIDGPFLFDDKYLPFTHPTYQELPLDRWLIGVRPTLMFSFWLNYKLSGGDAGSYHVLNVFLHFLNGLLVFLILRKLLSWAKSGHWQRDLIAAFGGCLFLLHPMQTEAVAYVASRSESLSVFFLYAALALFVYRRKTAISFFEVFLVLALFGGAITSKEHTAVLPFLLVLTDYFWNPGFSLEGIKRNWKLYVPVVVAGAFGISFILSKLAESDTAGFRVEGLPWYIYFVTQCKVIWFYVVMFVVPFGQNVDHDYPMVETAFDPLGLAGMVALVAAVVAAWIYRRRFPMVSYGFYVFLLLLAPTSSFVPIMDAFVERRLYLTMIGLLFMAAGLLMRWQTSRMTMASALGAIVLFTAFLGYQRAQVWAGPIPLWEDSVAKSPENWRANFQLAYGYYEIQRCTEADQQYAKTAALKEPDYRLLVDWGLAIDCAGRPGDAIAKLEEAAAIEPSAHVYATIAMMYGKQGQNKEALAALDQAQKLDRRFAITYFYRGNIYAAMGDHARAASQYGRALKRDPNLEAARRGLERSEQMVQQMLAP